LTAIEIRAPGRTENCQVGVFLAYSGARGRTLIDRRLYLPRSWTDDRERCRAAGIEDTIAFETKVVIAKAMVRRVITGRIPFRWVAADAAYGFSKGWRSELERADVFQVYPGLIRNGRLYLEVPYAQKDEAKRLLRAQWDREAEHWWVDAAKVTREQAARWLP